MKKIFSVMTLLGALAGAASALPYTTPSNPYGKLQPVDWQPVYALEGFYGIAANSADPDMAGVRGSFNLYSNGDSTVRHQFNVNIASSWGDTKYTADDMTLKVNMWMLPITVGYNINVGITDNVFLFAGAKAGYAFSHTQFKFEGEKESSSDGGFTYSVGGGIKVQCSESVYVHAGYEYGRTFFDVKGTQHHAIYGSHNIYAGVGCTF